jgi:hypothetical protein
MATVARAPSGSAIGRVFEHRYLSYKRTFRASIFSSFLSPVMFLAAMGIGLGAYVSDPSALGGVPYLAFLAPGLLAATAMQSASFESMFPIIAGLSGIGSSTRCTRRRSHRATSRSATSPGSRPGSR